MRDRSQDAVEHVLTREEVRIGEILKGRTVDPVVPRTHGRIECQRGRAIGGLSTPGPVHCEDVL